MFRPSNLTTFVLPTPIQHQLYTELLTEEGDPFFTSNFPFLLLVFLLAGRDYVDRDSLLVFCNDSLLSFHLSRRYLFLSQCTQKYRFFCWCQPGWPPLRPRTLPT
jgi:hypothetical protein